MNAPRKELKIIPVKIIVSTFMDLSIFLANNKTAKMVKKEKRILNKGRVNMPANGIDKPKNKVKTAPREAPEDTPIVYGSARGFLNKP
jgi:hypothetical protein